MFAKNLKTLRLQHNMEQIDLAYRLGRKSSSSISEWESGKYTPKAGILSDIAEIFNISLSDLMDKDLSETTQTKSSTKTILDNIFGKLEKPRQEIVINTAKEQLDEQNKDKVIKLFPYNVQEKLSAGTGYDYEGNSSHDIAYYDKEIDYDFASWVFGDSMIPDYPNGDVALIKQCPFDYDGQVYAVDWDGQSYIKKVYKEENGLRLVSTNEKYSDKFAPFSEEPRIIGKVVGSFTPIEK